MNKNLFFSFFLFMFLNINFAQEIVKVAKGKIITIADQKMEFVKLTIDNNEVSFININTNTQFFYLMNSIKRIEDENGQIIYALPEREKTPEQLAAEKEEKEENEKILVEKNKFLNYPTGIYHTKEEFISKKPSDTSDIYAKELYGLEKSILTSIEDKCFFYYNENDKKIKNVFAVFYKDNLFFPIKTILGNRNLTDRAQTNDNPNSFVRVVKYGENYLYMEATLVNQWAQGFAYSGGAVGGTLAASLKKEKGVVWDIKNNEFNIFKNCNDYNEFIKEKYPEGVQKCDNQQPDILEIRKAIDIVK